MFRLRIIKGLRIQTSTIKPVRKSSHVLLSTLDTPDSFVEGPVTSPPTVDQPTRPDQTRPNSSPNPRIHFILLSSQLSSLFIHYSLPPTFSLSDESPVQIEIALPPCHTIPSHPQNKVQCRKRRTELQ